MTANEALERMYGYMFSAGNGRRPMLEEYDKVNVGLQTLRDYHQIVSNLASAACILCDLEPQDSAGRRRQVSTIMDCVNRLQNVSDQP